MFFCKRMQNISFFFQYIYRYTYIDTVYIYIYTYINIYRKKNGTFCFNLIKRTLPCFTFFFLRDFQFLYGLWNQKEYSVFYKEQKRTQRSFRSFIKNGKESKDCSVLLKRTDAQPWSWANCSWSLFKWEILSERAKSEWEILSKRAKSKWANERKNEFPTMLYPTRQGGTGI